MCFRDLPRALPFYSSRSIILSFSLSLSLLSAITEKGREASPASTRFAYNRAPPRTRATAYMLRTLTRYACVLDVNRNTATLSRLFVRIAYLGISDLSSVMRYTLARARLTGRSVRLSRKNWRQQKSKNSLRTNSLHAVVSRLKNKKKNGGRKCNKKKFILFPSIRRDGEIATSPTERTS